MEKSKKGVRIVGIAYNSLGGGGGGGGGVFVLCTNFSLILRKIIL